MPYKSPLTDHLEPGFELRDDSFVGRGLVLTLTSRRTLCSSHGSRRVGPLMNLGKLPRGDDVVRRRVQHAEKLGARLVEAAQLIERAAECHPGRQIRWMLSEPCLAYPYRFLAIARPPVFLCELRKSNRRRILLDPASKVFNPLIG